MDRRTVIQFIGVALAGVACSKGTTSSAGETPSLTPVPAAERIPDEVLRSDASFNGTYRATWMASDGAKGTVTVVASIDPSKRTAHGTLSIGPGFFGSGSAAAAETVDLELDDFAYEKPPYSVTSSILGPLTVTGMGSLFVQLDSTSVPGHPEIRSLSIKGFVTGPDILADGGMPYTYQIHLTSGSTISGTAVFRAA